MFSNFFPFPQKYWCNPNDRERHDSNLTKEESLRVGLVDRALMAQVTLLSGIATGLGWWL